MKAAFIHDHKFVYNPDTTLFYDGSGGAFDVNLWNRYLAVFESLTVVGRQIENLPNQLVVSSAPKVIFRLIRDANGFRNILSNKARIKRELESVIASVDIVIIRLPSTLGRWGVEICQKLKKKYIIEVVGDPFEAYWHHGNWMGKIIAPVERIRLQHIVKNAQNVIYVTRNKLQNIYPCHNHTCAISNVRLEEVVDVSSVRAFYNVEKHVFRIGLIGSFHVKYKGHIEALKAIKRLKDKGYTAIELHLVGSGDSSWVKDLAKRYNLDRQVKVVGAVRSGKEGVFPFLDKLHFYIHPSKTEGLPRVIIESMSRGKICLGSNVGGTEELLESRYIHRPGDWITLSDQIERMINERNEDKIDIASNNLKTAQQYLEPVLQKRRVEFIRSIIE